MDAEQPAPAVGARRNELDLSSSRRLHVVGVGGAGMGPIARVLAAMGHRVSGSDMAASPRLERLAGLGIEVHAGHAASNIGDAEAVIVSTAVPPTNPEVTAATERGIPVLRRAGALAAIAAARRSVAVAGTHGKTTTSAMLATILHEAGLQPSFLVGGDVLGVSEGTGARWGSGEWLVVEADESDGTFLELSPEIAVVTSIEPDHVEHYGNFVAEVAAFDTFLQKVRGRRIVCADDPEAARLAARRPSVTYGTAEAAEFRITSVDTRRWGVDFTVEHNGEVLGDVSLPAPGVHNARNATAATVAAMACGVEFAAAARALASFGGVARRFQLRGEVAGVTVVEDYAHLPAEVAAAVSAAAQGGWQRVVCVFQPHRYSRTQALWAEFAGAFEGVDLLVVTDIYPAGEDPRPGVSAKLVLDAVLDARPHRRVAWFPSLEEVATYLRGELRSGDVCLVLGAGDVGLLPERILAGAGSGK